MQGNALDKLFDNIEKQVGKTEGFSQAATDNFYDFLKEGQFVIDGRTIDPDNNPWLTPIYQITRAQVLSNQLADGWTMFKPAQVGATVVMFLFLLWLCIGSEPLQMGYLFPHKSRLEKMVKTRFNPLLAHAKIAPYLAAQRVDTLDTKTIYNSTLHFIYTDGVGAVDSIALQILVLDEVRLMPEAIVEGAMYRMSAQDIRGVLYGSMAGAPGDVMSKSFEKSNQSRWHSRCDNCNCRTSVDISDRVDSRYGLEAAGFDAPTGLPLASLDIPQFIRPDAANSSAYEFFCYHTGDTIAPLNGGYEIHNPSSPNLGLHFGSFLRPQTTASVLFDLYNSSTNRAEFWNSSMGRAVIGAAGSMVNEHHTRDAVKLGTERGLEWGMVNGELFAGVDARTEELHLVIGTVDAICHVEILQGENVFARLEKRLSEWGVSFALVDYLPQTNMTKPLVRRNKNIGVTMFRAGATVRWLKEQKESDISNDIRETRMVLIDGVKGFRHAFHEFTSGAVAVPPQPKYQEVTLKGKLNPQYDVISGTEGFLDSLRNVAIVHRPKPVTTSSGQKLTNEAEFSEAIGKLNYDPHFAYAYLYYRMAILVKADGSVFISGTPTGSQKNKPTKQSPLSFSSGEMCGTCAWFVPDMGYCKARNLYGVASSRPKCQIPNLYQPKTF